MFNKKNILAMIMCVVLVLATLSGCAGGAKNSGGSGEKVLKIGVVLPLTGDAAKAGTEFRDAATMAFEEADYKIGDYKIEIVWVDQTPDPEKGSLALEQAIIKDKIDVAMLNWNSSVAIALMDVAAKYKIPYYFGIGASGSIDDKWLSDPEKYSYYIGKAWARSEYMVDAYGYVVDSIIEDGTWTPRNKNIAIYGDDSDWGRSLGKAIAEVFKARGWEVVYEDYFTTSQTDMYPILSSIKAADPSIIAGTVSSPASSAAFLKQAREIDLNALTICDALGENADFYELTGDASNFILDNRPKFTTEEGLAFEKKFEEKYNYKPAATTGGQVYDYTRFFIQCAQETLDKYGEINSENLYKFAQEVLLVGGTSFKDGIVCAEYKFSQEEFAPGPIVGEGYYIFPVAQYMNGESILVWPDYQKEADIQIPDYAK